MKWRPLGPLVAPCVTPVVKPDLPANLPTRMLRAMHVDVGHARAHRPHELGELAGRDPLRGGPDDVGGANLVFGPGTSLTEITDWVAANVPPP